MKPTRNRRIAAAAALSAIAIAVPASTASAAPPTRAVFPFAAFPYGTLAVGAWGGVASVPSTHAFLGQTAVVIGPTIITTAPSSFINTNNQVSANDNWSGGQFAG